MTDRISDVLADPERLISSKLTARILDLDGGAKTLAVWRSTNRHPDLVYLKFGRSIRYRVRDILAYIAAHERQQ